MIIETNFSIFFLTSNTACCVGRIVILWENLMRNITVLVVFCFLKINIVNLEINC